MANTPSSGSGHTRLNHYQPVPEPTRPRSPRADYARIGTEPWMLSLIHPARAVVEAQEFSMAADLQETGLISLLPTRDVAQRLVNAYFRFTNAGMPLLHEPTLQDQLDILYSQQVDDRETGHDVFTRKTAAFFACEVFSVAILFMQKRDPSALPTGLADKYHQAAIKALNDTGLPPGVEGVQALILLAQHSYHHPSSCLAWNTIGAALRLAVKLRLHREPPGNTLDPLTLDVRRRTFWVAYSMDVNLAMALNLPACMSEDTISVEVSIPGR